MISVEVLEKAGYTRFSDQFKRSENLSNDPYKGTWQKCIRDDKGKKYFINIEKWDFADSSLKDRFNGYKLPSYSAHAQFDGPDGTFNVQLLSAEGRTLQAIENWFEKQWKMNECDHYEKYHQEDVG